MKNIIAILVVLSGLFAVSCNNWLDVNPKTESEITELFEKEAGFEDALIGAYISLANYSTYGAFLTFNGIEHMANNYDSPTSSTEAYLAAHDWDYAYAETSINSTYSALYSTISSANAILEYIDVNSDVFSTEDNYKVIKGEALALRAMCHLDILRLFGPVPGTETSDAILRYVTEFGNSSTSFSTWAEYTTLLLQDLDEAEELMADSDPILTNSNATLAAPSDATSSFTGYSYFYAYRYLRLNYYAVKALQARANQWVGNDAAAAAAAIVVIEALDYGVSGKRFPLGSTNAFTSTETDFLFADEHIMAISDPDLYDKYSTYFSTALLHKGENMSEINTYIAGDIYGNSGMDFRETCAWWSTYASGDGNYYGICNKYFTEATTTDDNGLRIPLIRVSEMYLIVADCAEISVAQQYLDEFRDSRNLSSLIIDENSRAAAVVDETRKEFYAEGQMFYAYKRNNYTKAQILWAVMDTPDYVLPLPYNEY